MSRNLIEALRRKIEVDDMFQLLDLQDFVSFLTSHLGINSLSLRVNIDGSNWEGGGEIEKTLYRDRPTSNCQG